MSSPVIIEEMPYDPEFERAFAKAERNRTWFSEHVRELEVFKKYRGRYVAAAGGELFVADTAEEIDRLVSEKYPDEVPHVRYILREKCDRIYAYKRRSAADHSRFKSFRERRHPRLFRDGHPGLATSRHQTRLA